MNFLENTEYFTGYSRPTRTVNFRIWVVIFCRLEGGLSAPAAPAAPAADDVIDLTRARGEGERMETEDEMLRIAIEMSLR